MVDMRFGRNFIEEACKQQVFTTLKETRCNLKRKVEYEMGQSDELWDHMEYDSSISCFSVCVNKHPPVSQAAGS